MTMQNLNIRLPGHLLAQLDSLARIRALQLGRDGVTRSSLARMALTRGMASIQAELEAREAGIATEPTTDGERAYLEGLKSRGITGEAAAKRLGLYREQVRQLGAKR